MCWKEISAVRDFSIVISAGSGWPYLHLQFEAWLHCAPCTLAVTLKEAEQQSPKISGKTSKLTSAEGSLNLQVYRVRSATMVKAVAEFLVGAAVIVTPQYQVPLLLGSAALKLGRSLVKRSNSGGGSAEEIAQNGGDFSPRLVARRRCKSTIIEIGLARSATIKHRAGAKVFSGEF